MQKLLPAACALLAVTFPAGCRGVAVAITNLTSEYLPDPTGMGHPGNPIMYNTTDLILRWSISKLRL
jgi:hypothetical protein